LPLQNWLERMKNGLSEFRAYLFTQFSIERYAIGLSEFCPERNPTSSDFLA